MQIFVKQRATETGDITLHTPAIDVGDMPLLTHELIGYTLEGTTAPRSWPTWSVGVHRLCRGWDGPLDARPGFAVLRLAWADHATARPASRGLRPNDPIRCERARIPPSEALLARKPQSWASKSVNGYLGVQQ